MEPISTVTGAWTIAKGAGELSKKPYELGKSIKDRKIKQKMDEITDALRELKHQASLLEDENRSLKEKLKFNDDEYEFRNPFWYRKTDPNRPLCPKCFSKRVEAPIGRGANGEHPKCLVCGTFFKADLATASSSGMKLRGSAPASPSFKTRKSQDVSESLASLWLHHFRFDGWL